ncbi:YneF family protein [Aerococcus kribbianus]|uniref:UPF0154 protein OW157_00490 n=1 Tax=Aerococcus kribbianus TaxID=2999064 RepID=A0A9X3FN00_9LACT|nr:MULTISPECIES: YneF family protein [unclassified Aerococcus]MCZ0716753.1 YneF family protein [Aerococcus sp. YH-aer221]MCZ0725041.1 YneF family protein [Aerococcus sp. YH-aer222]
MTTGAWIFVVVIALLVGMVAGFFISRKYMVKYFEENPPISEEMIRTMMAQMGQKPSAKRVRQISQSMRGATKKRK